MDTPLSVTIVGLGPMGQAMTRTLLSNGVEVTVFNRTPSRADSLVAEGARRADTAVEAIDSAELIIVSLTHYQAMYDLLGDAAPRLRGRTIVNLSSDVPREAERASVWATQHGAAFLAGGIMVPATLVGDEAAYAFYSGPREVLDRHAATLGLLSRPDYVGEEPALALVWYQGLLDVFMTTLASVNHAAALVGSVGVRAERFVPYASDLLAQMPYFLDGTGAQLDAREYVDGGASLEMMAAGISHIAQTTADAGIDGGLPAAVNALYERALELGHAKDGSDSIHEAILDPTRTRRAG